VKKLRMAAVACAACWALPCAAQDVASEAPQGSSGLQVLSIDDAVKAAVDHNLNLLAARANLTIAEAQMITARLRPNPVMSASADSLDWLGTPFTEANGLGPSQYSLRVDVPFERGGKRELRIQTASFEKQIAEAEFADAVRRLRLDVMIACIDLLEAKAKLQLARDNLNTFEQLVQVNQRRLTSGAIPQVELTRVRVAMLQYRNTERAAELAVVQARVRLMPLIGRTADQIPVDVNGDLSIMPAVNPLSLATLQQLAKQARPDLKALRQEQARSQADLKLQLAQGKVDYTLGVAFERQHGVLGSANALGAFFSVPLPIFNRNQGEIARAAAQQDKSNTSIAALETDVSGEVTAAYQEFETARRILQDIETDLLTPSKQARETTAYVYQAGATSLLDVLDAQRAFNDTMETYYTAQADYRRAEIKLMTVAGQEVTP
jgi:cobalt-zinc-cadmium efflux system outer membrane protein